LDLIEAQVKGQTEAKAEVVLAMERVELEVVQLVTGQVELG